MANMSKRWTRLETDIVVDDTGGRPVLLPGRVEFAASPNGEHIATLSVASPEHENAQTAPALVRIWRCDPTGGAALERELRFAAVVGVNGYDPKTGDRVETIAVANDGAVAIAFFSKTSSYRTEVHDARGLRFALAGMWQPRFHPGGSLLTSAGTDLVQTDANSGAEIRRDRFDLGGLPYFVVAAAEAIFGFGGWLGRDGAVTPVERGARGASPFGQNVLLVGPDAAEVVDRRGTILSSVPRSVFAACEDGRHAIAIRMPSQEEAWAQGKSQYEARTAELVDVGDPASPARPLRALPLPQGRVVGWPAARQMTIAWGSKILKYDPLADAVVGGGPVEMRAAALAGARLLTAHDDGVRARDGGAGVQHRAIAGGVSRLIPSPNGARVLTAHADGWSVLDAITLEPVRVLGRCARPAGFDEPPIAWVDDARVVAVGTEQSTLLDLERGADRVLDSLCGAICVAATPGGFIAAFADRFELRAPDGAVTKTWKVPAKPKTFHTQRIQQIASNGSALWILAGGRMFRWDNGEISPLLASLDAALGVPKSADARGLHRRFALDRSEIALATRSERGAPWHGVVVARIEDETILGWSGPLTTDIVGLAWDGDAVLVAESAGVVRRLRITA